MTTVTFNGKPVRKLEIHQTETRVWFRVIRPDGTRIDSYVFEGGT